MFGDFFKTKPVAPSTKPRDLLEFKRAVNSQKKSMAQVTSSANVLDDLVKNMKGPIPRGARQK